MYRADKAYILIELLLGLVIILILVSIPLQKYKLLYRVEEKIELKKLKSSIEYIGMMASKEGNLTEISFKKNEYTLKKRDKKSSRMKIINSKKLKRLEIRFSPGYIQFLNSTHPIKDSSSRLTLIIEGKGSGRIYKVTICPITGRVRTKEL